MKNTSFYENLTQFVENLIFPALDWPSSALLAINSDQKKKTTQKTKTAKSSLDRKSKINLVWENTL